jgi:hypothetical protein
MIHTNKFIRSIFICSAIALSILTFSNPSSAGKKKIPYICATANDVIIRADIIKRNSNESIPFAPIGKMSKGQCIKLFTELSHLQIEERNGEKYYGLQRDMRGTGIHAGWVSTRFTKIQYR